MPRSYQVTPAVLGRRRATQALPVRPSSRRSSRESARRQPENQPDRTDVTAQTPRTMTVTAVCRRRPGINMVPAVNDSLYATALAPFLAEVQRMRPADAEVIDAHTHLGLDEDGRSLTLAQLLSQLDAPGARRACVFPLHDPRSEERRAGKE